LRILPVMMSIACSFALCPAPGSDGVRVPQLRTPYDKKRQPLFKVTVRVWANLIASAW
jgi:hypothetical protein